MSTAADPLIGQVLSGRFEILSPLGVGGMGRVYKAMQRPLDRVVALKVLNPRYDGSKDPGFEKRFFLEASMTAKLKHPNTITVHDYGRTDDGIYFIAMEYAEGETLQQVLANGPLPWPRALFIGAQIARSLREAHKLGLVHRDLKPANIMLLTEGTGGDIVKVLDFGLVKSFMHELSPELVPGQPSPNHTEITQAGVLLGSPMYMAPEQARNEADPRTDLYSLGVLMYQCIAGRPPFLGKESIDIIVKHIREAPPPLRSLVPELPFEAEALVMRCLEKDPAARYQNMDELLEAMRTATAGQGMSGIFVDPRTLSNSGVPRTSTPAVSPPSQATSPGLTPDSVSVEFSLTGSQPRGRSGLLVAAVVVGVLGVGAGGVVAWRAKPTEPVVSKPTPAPVPPPLPPRPVQVTFAVTSEPAGAQVTRDGRVVGVTPLTLSLERRGDAPVTLDVALSLEGYEPVTTAAQGFTGEVTVHQVLVKKAAPTPTPPPPPQGKHPTPRKPPNKPDNPPGYKDDPYQ